MFVCLRFRHVSLHIYHPKRQNNTIRVKRVTPHIRQYELFCFCFRSLLVVYGIRVPQMTTLRYHRLSARRFTKILTNYIS